MISSKLYTMARISGTSRLKAEQLWVLANRLAKNEGKDNRYALEIVRRMMKIESYRDLIVWQKSMELAVRCYRAAQALPKSEQQVLGYQLRKSSVSIPSNIAEGHSRHSTPHYIQHLWTAHASGRGARNASGSRGESRTVHRAAGGSADS